MPFIVGSSGGSRNSKRGFQVEDLHKMYTTSLPEDFCKLYILVGYFFLRLTVQLH